MNIEGEESALLERGLAPLLVLKLSTEQFEPAGLDEDIRPRPTPLFHSKSLGIKES